jgi:ABC-type dipeptide/oligopeptide/nickel transport system ATPase component
VVEAGPIDRVFGSPQHEYTQLLLASVPRLNARWSAVPAALVTAG